MREEVDMPRLVFISDGIAARPKAVIAVILIVSGILGGIYAIAGGELEATEQTFMPSTDLVNASQEIARLFETRELVQILVRSTDSNILLPEAMIEMLEVEAAVARDENVSALLLAESDPMRISSVADTLISAKGLLETIGGMAGAIEPQFLAMNGTLWQIESALGASAEAIGSSLGTPYLGQTLVSANQALTELVMQLAGMGGMPGAPGGGSGNATAGNGGNAAGYEDKIKLFENMSEADLRDLISSIMDYDGSATDGMVEAVTDSVGAASHVLNRSDVLDAVVAEALVDPAIAEDLDAQRAASSIRMLLGLVKNGVREARESAEGLGISKTAKQLDQGVEAMRRGIAMTLTRDFAPGTGALEAEGTLIIVGFNSTLARQKENNGEVLLRAEESMLAVLDQQELESTRMDVIAADLTSREILQATQGSMGILLPAAFALVVIVLALVYRNVANMLISLTALGLAILWTYGTGTAAGFVFNPMTLAVPVVIVGLGVDYGIHLTLRYREEISDGASPRDSARVAVTWVGSALLIATVTTVVAFMSNMVSDMSAIREFGILCSFGVVSAFIIMLTFVPSVRQLLDGRSSAKTGEKAGKKGTDRLRASAALGAGATAAEHHPRIIVVGTVLVTIGALLAASQLDTRFELEDFLPEDLTYTQNIRFVMDNFNTSTSAAQILLKGNVQQAEVLKAMEMATLNMLDDEFVAREMTTEGERPSVSSIVSLMEDVATDRRIVDPLDLYDEEFSSLFEESLDDGDRIPDRNVKALLDWLYTNEATRASARGLLHRDDQGIFDATVIRIETTSGLREDADRLYQELLADAEPLDELVEDGVLTRSTVTGSSIMVRQVTDSMASSMSTSFALTLVLSFLILTVVFWATEKSVVLGSITMIPVLLCSAWILGSMYLLGIPYTMLTIMVTALTIGLGVTYGIHLAHRFVEELNKTGDVDVACRETVTNTGAALFGAAATTVAGFGLLVFSLLPPVQEFGGIVALTIIFSFLATVFVLPTFLVIWAKRTRIRS